MSQIDQNNFCLKTTTHDPPLSSRNLQCRKTTLLEDNPTWRQPLKKRTLQFHGKTQEDNFTRSQPHRRKLLRKTTSEEENFTGRQPHWKNTLQEENLIGRKENSNEKNSKKTIYLEMTLVGWSGLDKQSWYWAWHSSAPACFFKVLAELSDTEYFKTNLNKN